MTTRELRKELLKYIKDLPKASLEEILIYIKQIKLKKIKHTKDNISSELSHLDKGELMHLEEEFKDYKWIYPRE